MGREDGSREPGSPGKLDVVQLPRDAKRPVLLRFDPSYDPIMRLRLSGQGHEPQLSLRYSAEKELKKLLESTSGVAAIKVIGGFEEQIRIEIDEKKLAELGFRSVRSRGLWSRRT